MPRGIPRNYIGVEVAFLDSPKWIALTRPERGDWLAIRLLSERQAERGVFASRDHIEGLAKKEGIPSKSVDRLIELHLLDELRDGSIVIHDLGEWSPDTSTERTRAWRERRGTVENVVDSVDNVPEVKQNGQERPENVLERSKNASLYIEGEESKNLPLTPSRGGQGSRANGTNPRSIAARKREEKKRRRNSIHLDYLAGKLTEAEEAEAYRRLDEGQAQA